MRDFSQINDKGAKRLGKAVVMQFINVWTKGDIEEWERDKKRFLSNSPSVLFWFMLAERMDLFEKLRKQYEETQDFLLWLKEKKVDFLKKTKMGKSLTQSTLLEFVKAEYSGWILVNKKSNLIEGFSEKEPKVDENTEIIHLE